MEESIGEINSDGGKNLKSSLPYAKLPVVKRRHLKEGEKSHTMHLQGEHFQKRPQTTL